MFPLLCRKAIVSFVQTRIWKNGRPVMQVNPWAASHIPHIRYAPKWVSLCTAPQPDTTTEGQPSVQDVLNKFSRFKDHQHFNPIESFLSALKNTDESDRTENFDSILTAFRGVSSGRTVTVDHLQQIWALVETSGEPDSAALTQCLRLYADARLRPPPALVEAAAARPEPELAHQLVKSLCAVGDMAEAGRQLERLRRAGHPLPETLVYAVIVGHGIAGDTDAARDTAQALLPAAGQDGAQPELSLMLAHVHARQPGPLATLLGRRYQEGGELRLDQCLRLVEALLETGQHEHVDQVLPLVPWSWYSDRTAACVRLQRHLVRLGRPQLALQLLGTALRRGAPEPDLARLARALLLEMAATGQTVSSLAEVCAALAAGPLLPRAWFVAAEGLYRLGRPQESRQLLMSAHRAGVPLREHLFWPALLPLAAAGDVQGVRETLLQMLEAGLSPSLETLRDYVLPVYLAAGRPAGPQIVQQLKDCGLTVSAVIDALVGRLLGSRLYEEAATLCERYCSSASVAALVGAVSHALQNDAPVAPCVRVLRCAFQRRSEVEDPVGAVLMDLTRSPATAARLVEALRSTELRLSPLAADLVAERLGRPADGLLQRLAEIADDAVSSHPWEDVELGHFTPQNMSVDQLEDHLVELTRKGGNTRGVLRKLLLSYCRKNNLQQALRVEKELLLLAAPGEQEPLTAGLLSALMAVHVHHGHLEPALAYKRRLDALNPDEQSLDQHKLIDLAALLVRRHRPAEALSLVSQLSPVSDQSRLSMNCWRLLSAAADGGDAALAHNLLHQLVERGVAGLTAHNLGQLVRAHVNLDDLAGAVDEFSHCVKTHGAAPWSHGLLLEILKVADEPRRQQLLETVVKQLGTLYGTESAQYRLALACAESGFTSEARTLFQALGPDAHFTEKRLKRYCGRLSGRRQTDDLKRLLRALPERPPRAVVYWALLNAHEQAADAGGAEDVLQMLDEDEAGRTSARLVQHARQLVDRLRGRR